MTRRKQQSLTAYLEVSWEEATFWISLFLASNNSCWASSCSFFRSSTACLHSKAKPWSQSNTSIQSASGICHSGNNKTDQNPQGFQRHFLKTPATFPSHLHQCVTASVVSEHSSTVIQLTKQEFLNNWCKSTVLLTKCDAHIGVIPWQTPYFGLLSQILWHNLRMGNQSSIPLKLKYTCLNGRRHSMDGTVMILGKKMQTKKKKLCDSRSASKFLCHNRNYNHNHSGKIHSYKNWFPLTM